MLLDKRTTVLPSHYPQADKYWEDQQMSHWIHREVTMGNDVNDWMMNLTPAEKGLVGYILKGFAQTEHHIEEYWGSLVSDWFPHPEIRMMCSAFANMESVHLKGYLYLNETLGLTDFESFLADPEIKAKMDRLTSVSRSSDLPNIARSLAIFSAFNEGVNLFSSFAILLNYSRFNKLKGVGQIIAWSCRDESLHSEAGCWLFNTLVAEYPHIWTDELKKDLYDAARLTVKLEDDFIDKAFSEGAVEGITAHDMKQFIRFRTNLKLTDIGLKTNWKTVDKEAVRRITEWFEPLTSGVEHADFFAGRVTAYSKASIVFDDSIWD